MITVLGYGGQKIGEASNYADAKAMQYHDIKEHRPDVALGARNVPKTREESLL